MAAIRGLVIRSQSGFYSVETEEGVVEARLRGRLKQGRAAGDIVALGDWVWVESAEGGEVMIEEVEERVRALVRKAPRPQGVYEQVIVANLDQAFFVFACAEPAPKFRMLDRLLVAAEQQEIPTGIVITKIDLIGKKAAKKLFDHYEKIGYPLYYTSAEKKQGIRKLNDALNDKISVLAGPSGAGKSSLLNLIQPELALRVREVQQSTGKGRHTTVERKMFPLEGGGYVADTPGLKAFALMDIEAEELDGYFREIAPLVVNCQFRDCTHSGEPGCAVIAAVEAGEVHPERFESYLRLRAQHED
jgi:ribosome biogenesis GTPase